jgi:hypothetical protein
LYNGGTTPAFNNSGTFTRSVGSGTTTISIPFNNSNIVSVQAGTLVLAGGGTETGSSQAGLGATLSITSSSPAMTFAAGATLSGPGTINITGVATVTGPAVTFGGGGLLHLTGTLNGSGTITATAPIEWTGGIMSGGGVTTAIGGVSIDGYQNSLDTRTLNIGGLSTFTGSATSAAGYLYMSNGAKVNNSGNFDLGWSANFNNAIINNGSPGPFTNNGTCARSVGSGTTSVQVPFTNNGAIDVSAGKLEFDSDFSLGNSSSLNVSGGTLKFVVNSGTASVGSGVTAIVSGNGILELAGSISVLGVASPAADRVTITNNSSAAAGLLVATGSHQVGAIGGTGNVQVNAGTNLTANSIIAGALVVGGQSGIPGRVTIDASNASGQPLDIASGDAFSLAGAVSDEVIVSRPIGDASFAGSSRDTLAVPEPSTLAIAMTALVGVLALGRRRFA